MPISNERRHYLTLPDEDYKKRLEQLANDKGMSMSTFIVWRLDLLEKIERDPVGKALVLAKTNGTP